MTEPTDVALSEMATEVWQRVQNDRAQATIEDGISTRADEGVVKRLLTNLFRNAIEHAEAVVTIKFGKLGDGDDFYVEDNGSGVPSRST